MNPKKPVHSSHLALRFYKHHGWTKDILDKYLVRGRVVDQWVGQEVRDYWFLDHEQSSNLNMAELFKNEISVVHRWYDGPNRESDFEYLRSMNW